jgi:GT2 family glycosyltransferase
VSKREIIEKIALMPEEYFLYYEDTDWSLKARQAGFKCIFVPAAKIWHKGSKSSVEGSPSYIYYHIRNGLILAQRFAPWYVKPLVHLDVGWRIIEQIIKMVFLPKKRTWAKAILLGIKDFYLGKRGKVCH